MKVEKSTKQIPLHKPKYDILNFDKLKWNSESDLPNGVMIYDLEKLLNGEGIKDLKNTLEMSYPFYIKNFGISEEDVESIFNITRKFFNQPEKEKEKMKHESLPLILRGYSAYGTGAYENSLNNGKAINQYTKYAWGPGNNVSPNTDFEETYNKIQKKLSDVANKLLECIGDALELKSHDEWDNLFGGEDTVLHCQCYYPEEPLGDGRMITHADASSVTLLYQLPSENGHIGLKAKLGEEYVGIPAIRGSIVIMTGESLNSITNSLIKPVMHAVTGPTTDIENSERSSMPFFVNPRNKFKMNCPLNTTHRKFYNKGSETTFGEYSSNIATAYLETENSM